MLGELETIKLHHDTLHTIVNLDTWDVRLVNSTLNERNQKVLMAAEELYPVDLTLYQELCSLKGQPSKAYEKAKASAIRLRDASLEIKLEGNKIYRSSIIHSVLYSDSDRTINLSWNELFVPLVSGKLAAGEFLQPAVIMAELTHKRYSLYLLISKDLWKLRRDTGFRILKEDILKAVGARRGQAFGEINANYLKPVIGEFYNKLGLKLSVKVSRRDYVEVSGNV